MYGFKCVERTLAERFVRQMMVANISANVFGGKDFAATFSIICQYGTSCNPEKDICPT
jgi:hypothetical protein